MSKPKIIKFGAVTEVEDGSLLFKDFVFDGDGTELPSELALLQAIEDRLKRAKSEYLENQLKKRIDL